MDRRREAYIELLFIALAAVALARQLRLPRDWLLLGRSIRIEHIALWTEGAPCDTSVPVDLGTPTRLPI